MDLKKEILDYLENKKDWDIFVKIRYVYLQLCSLFSYDYRYLYGTEEEKQSIYNNKPNSSNITEFKIVCSSWCSIAKDIYKELGLQCEITFLALPHVFLILYVGDYKIKMDPMKDGYDLTRVKVGSKAFGVRDLNGQENFEQKIRECDKKIYGENYIYLDDCVKALCKELQENGYYINLDPTRPFSYEVFNYKFELLQTIMKYTKRVFAYDDCDRYFDYLSVKLMTQWERYKIHKNAFWKCENGTWQIMNLIAIEQDSEKALYYKMEWEEGKYNLNSMTEKEIPYYLDNYDGKTKQLYREFMR